MLSVPSRNVKRSPSPAYPRSRLTFFQRYVTEPARSYFYSTINKTGVGRGRSVFRHKHSLSLDDVESQEPGSSEGRASTAAEYDVDTNTKISYLAGWFMLNLAMTIYNKALLGGFAFPWLITTLHAVFISIGCPLLMLQWNLSLTQLSTEKNLTLIAFSFLFTLNIAMSNVSLAAVSVPFHQTMRSTCPAITIIIYRLFFGRSYARDTYLSLIPIIFGVALATYGDYYFSLAGFVITLFGVVLAAAKTVVTNILLTGDLALPALEVLFRMAPLAAAQSFLYACFSGEMSRFLTFAGDGHLSWSMCLALAGNGFIAFLLNISSFQSNKHAGALTLTVAGNMKQCLTILLGIVLFNVEVSFLNGAGMLVTLFGGAWYSKVELDSKGRR